MTELASFLKLTPKQLNIAVAIRLTFGLNGCPLLQVASNQLFAWLYSSNLIRKLAMNKFF